MEDCGGGDEVGRRLMGTMVQIDQAEYLVSKISRNDTIFQIESKYFSYPKIDFF